MPVRVTVLARLLIALIMAMFMSVLMLMLMLMRLVMRVRTVIFMRHQACTFKMLGSLRKA